MSGATIEAMRRDTKLFQELDADARAFVSRLMTVETYRPGQYLFHERAEREAVLVIEEGKIIITHGIGQQPAELATLGPGAILGERLLLGSPTHVAAAKAITSVRVLCLSKAATERIEQERPDIYQQLVLVASKTLAERLEYSAGQIAGTRAPLATGRFRIERDSLGERHIPEEMYYGIQTQRVDPDDGRGRRERTHHDQRRVHDVADVDGQVGG